MEEPKQEEENVEDRYPLFSQITDINLRAYNRYVTALNLRTNGGQILLQEYISKLSKLDVVEMKDIVEQLKTKTLKELKLEIIGSITLDEEDNEQ